MDIDIDAVKFHYEVLALIADTDTEIVFFRCDGEYAPVTFFVIVNDIFAWASADTEKITPDDMEDIKQALQDVREIDDFEVELGFLLWVSRKRKQRIQYFAMPDNKALRKLFEEVPRGKDSTV